MHTFPSGSQSYDIIVIYTTYYFLADVLQYAIGKTFFLHEYIYWIFVQRHVGEKDINNMICINCNIGQLKWFRFICVLDWL